MSRLDDQLLPEMTACKEKMLRIGELLREKSCRDWHIHAAQIEGAAQCLQTWIDGIQEEAKDSSCQE